MEKAHRPHRRKEPLTTEHLSAGLKSRIDFARTPAERIADFLTQSFGTVFFLLINLIFFALWLLINSGIVGIPEFDPPPYNLLTMVVSLEAIFLSIIVLMSQNRAGKIADIRQKMDFEIDVVA